MTGERDDIKAFQTIRNIANIIIGITNAEDIQIIYNQSNPKISSRDLFDQIYISREKTPVEQMKEAINAAEPDKDANSYPIDKWKECLCTVCGLPYTVANDNYGDYDNFIRKFRELFRRRRLR